MGARARSRLNDADPAHRARTPGWRDEGMSPEEFEQQHKALHMIGMTVRQGRPSLVVCPACEAKREREAFQPLGPKSDNTAVRS